MKNYSTIILKCTIAIAALIILTICFITLYITLNHDTSSQYYYLMLAFMTGFTTTSIPSLIALWQTFKILCYIDKGFAFSESSSKSLKIIWGCSIAAFLVTTLAGLPFFYFFADMEDAPGLVFVGLAISGTTFIIAVFASVLNKLLQEAIYLKKENELTV